VPVQRVEGQPAQGDTMDTCDRLVGRSETDADVEQVGGNATALAYIVHELRSPLTVIRGFAEMLADRAGTAGTPYAAAIVRNAQEMERRLELVEEARRGFDGPLPLRLQVCDLGEVVAALLEDMAGHLGGREVRFRCRRQAALRADPSRLRQAVGNLVSNAVKHSCPSSAIEVAVDGDCSRATVSVIDHGPGIPPHQQPMLFRPFTQLDPSRPGMGLGLFLVRCIAEAHGGDAAYEARGGGSTFTLTIPRNLAGGNEAHHS